MSLTSHPRITVVGLGYVGLPLAVALADHFEVIGLDIDATRIEELRRGHDRTNEIDAARLSSSTLRLSAEPDETKGADLFIVTVPTPVDSANRPDLRPVIAATETVAGLLDATKQTTIVYESTVYPGVTEEICGPLIERVSGLSRGTHFFLGYSPERINPGDTEHTIDRIIKVVAGENEAVTDQLATVYGQATSAGTFRARSIKTAEAAKVIENAQRDINIAFVNEVTRIFAKLDLSVWDVLETAGTKWNFLRFQPGLVGGHCIGVDPYYLSHLAQQLGHEPRVILAGREINDSMGGWVAEELHARRGGRAGKALILGITFKENVPDIRNSRVIDIVTGLDALGWEVTIHDPLADSAETAHEYHVTLDRDALSRRYDLVVCAVAHDEYRQMDDGAIEGLLCNGGLLADLKAVWRGRALAGAVDRWSL